MEDAESSGDVNEIRAAQGVYTPDSNTAVPSGTGDREATFQLVNGVALRGGYAGSGETDPNARDVEMYETILSGDLDGNDVEVVTRVLFTEPTRAENSYHVVNGSNADANTVLDGFTITSSNANGNDPHDKGGGMYNDSGNPTVANCVFTFNSAGTLGVLTVPSTEVVAGICSKNFNFRPFFL